MNYYAKRFFGQQGIVTDGLKLWLDASNPLSYPGTGTLWSDLSGNGNNGTMINGVAYSTANGGVMSFDGVNDTVNFPNSLIVSNLTGHTISLWIKRDNKTGYQGIMTVKNGFGVNCNILMLSGTSNNYPFAYGGTNMPTKSSTTPLTVGLWYNCTFVAYNYSLTLYINGEIITDTYSPPYGGFGDDNNIGKYAGNYLSAQLNEPLIYNRALTASEVLQNYNATKSKYGL